VSDDLVAWLRPKVEADLTGWRERETHFRAVREREGDYHYFEAREQVARLEAQLAILDEHYILWRHDTSETYEEFSVVAVGSADKDHGCVTCHYYGMGGVKGYGYCRTVRHLGAAYRHRPGYREEWKP
jgi:Family of unknown function (DUF6221)